MMCSGVHQKHAKEHDVASDAAGLRVMDLYCCFRSQLVLLNIEETAQVSFERLLGMSEWTYLT